MLHPPYQQPYGYTGYTGYTGAPPNIGGIGPNNGLQWQGQVEKRPQIEYQPQPQPQSDPRAYGGCRPKERKSSSASSGAWSSGDSEGDQPSDGDQNFISADEDLLRKVGIK